MDIIWWIYAGCVIGSEIEDTRNEVLVHGCGKVVSLGGDIVELL